jgi:predicted O-methyltransferase YrrM
MVEKARQRMLCDNRLIKVDDLGSGMNRTKLRRVADIAKRSAVPEKYGVLLANLASKFGNGTVIELGTSLGISTMYIAASCPSSTVYSVEGSVKCMEIAEENLNMAGIRNVELINSSFASALAELRERGVRPSLVYIDGDHRREPTLRYFSELSIMCEEHSVVIIDDIHYSGEMKKAWNEIRFSPNVSSTIDIFRMGIVFLRQNITRKHYTVRY